MGSLSRSQVAARTAASTNHSPGVWWRLTLAAICLTALPGCELGPKDLDAYSRTAAGPAKIRAIIGEDQYGDDLRADAVVTLLDLERDDVDGEKLAMSSLQRLPGEARQGILQALLQRLGPRVAADSVLDEAAQVRAKDALSALVPLAEGEVRKRYGELLIEWYARAPQDRARSGQYGLDQLVAQLDDLAAAPLTAALHARLPATELRQLASLLAGVAHGAARNTAAKKLIQIETRWRSDGRLAQLESELRETMADGTMALPPPQAKGMAATREALDDADALAKQAPVAGGAKPDAQAEATTDAPAEPGQENWLRAQADAQRHREIETALLPALGWFADTDAVSNRLLALGLSADPAIPDSQRELALRLLEGHTHPAQVGELLTLAIDRERPLTLRKLGLARASENAGSEALPQLLALMGARRYASLRQGAAELVLEIGGGGALGAFFRAMPTAWTMDYSRSELDAYAQRMAEIEPDRPTLNLLGTKLHSAYWWARFLALQYYAQRGSYEDLWRIRQHVHDTLLVRGSEFPPGYTIGQEAQAAVAVALRRIRGRDADDASN